MIQALSTTTHVARKRHLCSYCELRIQPGETYDKAFIVESGSGDSWQWKNHPVCQELADKLVDWDDLGREGLTSQDFQSYVIEDYRSRHGLQANVKWPDMLEEVKKHHGL